jgi:hypothetical protein
MMTLRFLASAAFLAAICASAQAAVTAEEAKQLGTTLTPWGAEMAGSKSGLVPAYGKDIIKVPANFDPKGVRPDPYAKEKPLFTVTAANAAQHADKLTEGMKEVLAKYPTMRMDIYPSHRTVTYPKLVVDNTLKNATACKLEQGGNKLVGCYGGMPFPIPKTGIEVIWNKLTSYVAPAWSGTFVTALVTANGDALLQGINAATQDSPYYDPNVSGPLPSDTLFWRVRVDLAGPARRVGESLLILDSIDFAGVGRKAWQYLPGQRRVKLAPGLSYDTPSPQAGGSSTMDEIKVFAGAPDRYEWKLIGKKELFLPYNNFRLEDPALCTAKILFTKNHPNPDCVRWETHRVWVVEANLKAGARHIYPKRMMYFDEDVPAVGIADEYDAAGKIVRVSLTSYFPMYEAQGLATDNSLVLDLATGAWVALALSADYGGTHVDPVSKGNRFFTPDAMAGSGIR